MNRLLVRRCSMSSIEEEDEPTTSDDLTVQPERPPSTSIQQHVRPSSSVPDWDSELSESEQEFDDNDDDDDDDGRHENGEDRAANRALQNFVQTCSRTVSIAVIFLWTRISEMIRNPISIVKAAAKDCIKNHYDNRREQT